MDLSPILPFQTTIVGIVGFSGVMLTMRHNARLARQQRDAAISHERMSIRVALKEELSLLRDAYNGNAADLANIPDNDDGGFDIPPYDMTQVYQAVLGKIGALTSNELSKVLHAYGTVAQADHLITAFYALPGEITGEAIRVPASKAHGLAKLYENAVAAATQAIDALSTEIASATKDA